MEIKNASTTPSKSNQLRNVNTVRWESWIVTTQPLEINDRKSIIAFVVNALMLIKFSITFYFFLFALVFFFFFFYRQYIYS